MIKVHFVMHIITFHGGGRLVIYMPVPYQALYRPAPKLICGVYTFYE